MYTDSMNKKEPIRLKKHQKQHVINICNTLKTHRCVLDYSKTGCGKSVTTSAISSIMKLPIILISTGTVKHTWRKIQEKYNVQILEMLSYEMLAGKSNSGCNNRYLTRTKGGKYSPTDYLIKSVKDGVLFVFDETSKLKNFSTLNQKAAHTIIKQLHLPESRSRGILLSALPGDKPDNIISILQMLSIMIDDTLFNYVNRKYELTGILDIYSWCKNQNQTMADKVFQIYSMNGYNKQKITTIAVELFRKIVSPKLTFCMPTSEDNIDVKNGYYNFLPEDMKLINEGLKMLNKATNCFENGKRSINMGLIIKGQTIISRGKLNTVYRLTLESLQKDPNRKIVIGCWYPEHIRILENALQDYGALSLYGEIPMKNRSAIINKFQKHDNESRVIIVNPTVGGMGIDLDDQYGDQPRTMYIIPDYRFMDLVQLTGRVCRSSTKSKEKTKIRIIYSKENPVKNILNSLFNKSESSRIIITDKNKLRLPDSYDTYIEPNL